MYDQVVSTTNRHCRENSSRSQLKRISIDRRRQLLDEHGGKWVDNLKHAAWAFNGDQAAPAGQSKNQTETQKKREEKSVGWVRLVPSDRQKFAWCRKCNCRSRIYAHQQQRVTTALNSHVYVYVCVCESVWVH